MKLILAFSSSVAIISALLSTTAENADKHTEIIIRGKNNTFNEFFSEEFSFQEEATDLRTSALDTLAPIEHHHLNFSTDQMDWFGGALDRLEHAQNRAELVSPTAILFGTMSEDQVNKLGLTKEQFSWSIGMITNLVHHMKQNETKITSKAADKDTHTPNNSPAARSSTKTTVMRETTTLTTDILKTSLAETTTNLDPEKKDAAKPKSSSSKESTENNMTTNGSKSTGTGVHATRDVWAVFGGALTAVFLLLL